MMLRWTLLSVVVAGATIGLGVFAIPLVFAHRVAPGVYVGELSVGGTSIEDLNGVLAHYGNTLIDTPVALRFRGRTQSAMLRDLGFTLDVETTVEKVMSARHMPDGYPLRRIRPILNLDAIQGRAVLRELFADVLTLPRNASLRRVGGKFVLVPSASGEQVDLTAFKRDVLERVHEHSSVPVQLSVITDVAPVQDHEVARAQTLAAHLLQTGFVLTFEDEEWTIKPYTLRRLVAFSEQADPRNSSNTILGVKLNQEGLRTYLENTIRPEVDRESVNARFVVQRSGDRAPSFDVNAPSSNWQPAPRFVDGIQAAPAPRGVSSGLEEDSPRSSGSGGGVRVVQFAASQQGRKLDIGGSVKSIQQALARGKASAPLVVTVTEPDIVDSVEVDGLGIATLLAVGTSDFRGSPRNRVHNIRIGAERYHGLLIAPGEEFSFNKFLGPVNASSGFRPELVIKENVTIPEYGGGLCQVSTTAFRAAVSSGMKILQRRNHAYAVSYYGTPGFDATIYPPYTDLRFLNNTPGYILIQTKIEGTKLIFEFWGTDDGREVEIVGPSPYNRTEDGAVKAVLKQRVVRDGAVIIEDTFYSNYKSPKLFPKVLSAGSSPTGSRPGEGQASRPGEPQAVRMSDESAEKKKEKERRARLSPSTPTPAGAATQDKDAAKQEAD